MESQIPISFKKCRRCLLEKQTDCFGWSGYIKKDGQKSLCSYCKTCQNELRVQRKFGLTYEDYKKILAQQGGCCANLGCRSQLPGAPGRSRFYIDHCHKTNKIRGLLCHQCNLALGHVKDNIQILKGLIKYLEENK